MRRTGIMSIWMHEYVRVRVCVCVNKVCVTSDMIFTFVMFFVEAEQIVCGQFDECFGSKVILAKQDGQSDENKTNK